MPYLDNSGLYQKYGTEQTVTQAGGEYKTFAELREVEIKINLATLGTANTPAPVVTGADNIFFPAGMLIEQVEIVIDAAATSGGSATLDIGLIRTDRVTEVDYQAFVKGYTLATGTAGSKTTLIKGSAFAGDLLGTGTATANVGYITANANVAVFTAGIATVRIKYRKP